MPFPTEKVKKILLECHFIYKLESSHMRASIVSTLPYIRPRANCWRFMLILKTLVDDSEMSEMLNPTESSIVSPLCSGYSDFKDFVWWASEISSKTEIAVTIIPQSTNGKLYMVNQNISWRFQNVLVVSKPLIHPKWYELCMRFFGPLSSPENHNYTKYHPLPFLQKS